MFYVKKGFSQSNRGHHLAILELVAIVSFIRKIRDGTMPSSTEYNHTDKVFYRVASFKQKKVKGVPMKAEISCRSVALQS